LIGLALAGAVIVSFLPKTSVIKTNIKGEAI